MAGKIDELTDIEKGNIQNCYMLGVLAEDDEQFPKVGMNSESVTNMKTSFRIIFFIRRLTELPLKMIDNDSNRYAICFADHIPEHLKKKLHLNSLYIKEDEKIDNIKTNLLNKLIVFKPFLQSNHFNATLHDIIDVPKGFKIQAEYKTIPFINEGIDEFENKLLKYLPINMNEYNDEIGNPEFIICNDKIYYIESWTNTDKGKIAQNIDKIKNIKIPKEYESSIVKIVGNRLVCLATDTLMDLRKLLDKSGEKLQKENNNLVDTVYDLAKEKGLIYEKQDIYNFELSLKTGRLVILSGMSGVGKSKLVEIYAKALNLDDASQSSKGIERGGLYKIIPVKASWSDDTDLVGYLDTINNLYRPSDNGLVKLLIEAEKNSNKKYIICLDEMNLARAEYYFSDFLSILEMENRILQLYNPTEKVYNTSEYPDNIKIGSNVYFIGTVNVDESTFRFSDKVLDRANVIRLEPCKFIKWYELLENDNKNDGWDKNEILFLDELNELLMKVDSQKGIGYRVVKQIIDYVKQIDSDNNLLNRSEAFDIQVVQRILTKIRGTKDIIGSLIGCYDELKGLYESSILELCKKYNTVSEFNHVEKELIRKSRELKNYEYTA